MSSPRTNLLNLIQAMEKVLNDLKNELNEMNKASIVTPRQLEDLGFVKMVNDGMAYCTRWYTQKPYIKIRFLSNNTIADLSYETENIERSIIYSGPLSVQKIKAFLDFCEIPYPKDN